MLIIYVIYDNHICNIWSYMSLASIFSAPQKERNSVYINKHLVFQKDILVFLGTTLLKRNDR